LGKWICISMTEISSVNSPLTWKVINKLYKKTGIIIS
jgi:hypothetical protein